MRVAGGHKWDVRAWLKLKLGESGWKENDWLREEGARMLLERGGEDLEKRGCPTFPVAIPRVLGIIPAMETVYVAFLEIKLTILVVILK